MSRLTWDEAGSRFYEAGVDRGVFYPDNEPGVVWNGLVSVGEAPVSEETELNYLDGVPIHRRQVIDSFAGTIEAYTYPVEFEIYEGFVPGPRQSNKLFGFSYRSGIGNDVNGFNHAYKIHIVYNASATPSEKEYTSVNSETTPVIFSWDFTTTPMKILGSTRSAHLIVDTRNAYSWAIEALEAVLYGSEFEAPRLPPPEEVLAIFEEASIVQITDHGDGTWTAEGPDDAVKLLDPTTFEIAWPSAVYIDEQSYFVSSL